MLERELQYFSEHRRELTEKYHRRFVLIRGEEVVGDFATELDAYTLAKRNGYPAGSFLIQQCLSENEETPQVFHSRVHFPDPVAQ